MVVQAADAVVSSLPVSIMLTEDHPPPASASHAVKVRDVFPLQMKTDTNVCQDTACGFSSTSISPTEMRHRNASMRKLLIVIMICIIFIVIEVVGGLKANSLAIFTDAMHLLSDVVAFGISFFSLWASGWEATPRQSYGFFRLEILGALVSMQLIWLMTGVLVYQAFGRLIHGSGHVDGFLMFIIALVGFIMNAVMAVILGHSNGHCGHSHLDHNHDKHSRSSQSHSCVGSQHEVHHHALDAKDGHGQQIAVISHHSDSKISDHAEEDHKLLLTGDETFQIHSGSEKFGNINVHGAFLHVLGDLVQSIGVMIAGGIIWYKPEWQIIDLVCTLLFSIIVLTTTLKMLRNVFEVLMESTPRDIDATVLEKGVCEIDGVVAIHDLHIWAITVGKVFLSSHVIVSSEADAEVVLDKIVGYIRREFLISNMTIQIERQRL